MSWLVKKLKRSLLFKAFLGLVVWVALCLWLYARSASLSLTTEPEDHRLVIAVETEIEKTQAEQVAPHKLPSMQSNGEGRAGTAPNTDADHHNLVKAKDKEHSDYKYITNFVDIAPLTKVKKKKEPWSRDYMPPPHRWKTTKKNPEKLFGKSDNLLYPAAYYEQRFKDTDFDDVQLLEDEGESKPKRVWKRFKISKLRERVEELYEKHRITKHLPSFDSF